MKKLIVLVLGLMLVVSVFAVSISTTSAKINNVYYSCKGSAHDPYDTADLGNIGSLALNGTLKNIGTTTLSSATMYYRFNGVDWHSKLLGETTTYTDGERTPIDPVNGGTSINTYALMKTLTTYVTFYGLTNTNVILSELVNGQTYNLDIYFRLSTSYDPADADTSYYTATFTKIADIGFVDGSSYSPGQATKGNTTEIIGRFWLDSDVSGAILTNASFDLEGIRTGFSNFKLWSSSDGVLDGGDTQLGSTIAVDPQASPAVFSSLSKSISTSGDYYFLTADVDIEATGSIRAYIAEAADLTVTDGIIGETIASAPLTSTEVPTSICLSSFTAALNNGKVELAWTTATETENDHFNIYRDGEVIAQVEGNGTTSETHSYQYTDTRIQGGIYEYAISDVTWGGIETVHAPVLIEIREDLELNDFVLNNAYPNPFNPRTVIRLQYAVGSNTVVNIYNTQGVLVDQLINGFVEAGNHDLTWDASNMPSGVYLVTMQAGNTIQSQKIVLMK